MNGACLSAGRPILRVEELEGHMMNMRWIVGLALLLAVPGTAQTKIGAVQGTGKTSPQSGQTADIRGIVTASFQDENQLGGFFVQDEGDGNEATSDGIFVYAPLARAGNARMQPGDMVDVRGRVEEFGDQTQLGRPQIAVRGRGALPKPLALQWPLPEGIEPERYEGMLVTFAQTFTVAGNYQLGRYGTLTLAAGGRLFTPGSAGGDAASEQARMRENARRVLLLDDGQGKSNPKPVPYLNAAGTRRSGDTVSSLTGILSEGYSAYRLQPTATPQFSEANPRPPVPTVGGNLTVASFNLHNYFITLKRTGNEARGATSAPALEKQGAKLLAAIKAMNPDILGCIEVENNGDETILSFLQRLNAVTGNAYAAVALPANGLGTDAIRVALLYKPAKVSPRGVALSANDAVFERFPMAQAFATPNGAVFSVIVNHFKSKGGCPDTGDVDEGEGCWNARRTAQAKRLLQFVEQVKASSGSPDVLVLGDLNAYANEAPLRALRDGGLKAANDSATEYSYIFDGQSGSLDHAFATPSLAPKITAALPWHINADEPEFLDYSESKTPPAEADYFRSSDHDPLLIGLKF